MSLRATWRRPVELASKLFGSTVLAQLAVMGATAFAAARLSPGDFAWYGAMSGAVWIAGSFNSLAVEHRLGVVSEPVYHSLLRAGLTSVSVVSVACFLGAIGGSALGEVWGPMGFLVGVAAFGLGLQQLLTASILRQQRQGVLARGRLIQGVTNAVLIVASVFTPVPGYLGLSLAWAASIFFGLVPLIFAADFRIRGLGRPRRSDFTQLWREVKLLPVSQAMAGSVASLPLIVLPGLGNDSISGAWALVSRFLTPMVNTAYTTLQPLYYGGAAEILREDRREEFKRFHARWVALLFVGSLPVLAFFVVCIQWLIPLLGDSWDVAKLVVVPGCVYFTSGFICLPISHTLVLLGQVNAQFWWTAVRCLLCLTPFLAVGTLGAGGALLWWAIAAAATFFAQIVMHRQALASPGAAASSAA